MLSFYIFFSFLHCRCLDLWSSDVAGPWAPMIWSCRAHFYSPYILYGMYLIVYINAIFQFLYHFSFVLVAVSLVLFEYNTSVLSVKLLFYHLIGYLLILFCKYHSIYIYIIIIIIIILISLAVSICVEIGICVISMRGSILDSEARTSINIWIYLKSCKCGRGYIFVLRSINFCFPIYSGDII